MGEVYQSTIVASHWQDEEERQPSIFETDKHYNLGSYPLFMAAYLTRIMVVMLDFSNLAID